MNRADPHLPDDGAHGQFDVHPYHRAGVDMHCAAPQFNPFQPLATSQPGTMMRNLVIAGLAIVLALFVALVVVLLMGMTKKPAAPAPASAPKTASVTAPGTNAETPTTTQAAVEPAQQLPATSTAPAVADTKPATTTQAAAKPAGDRVGAPAAHHEASAHRPMPLPGTPEADTAN